MQFYKLAISAIAVSLLCVISFAQESDKKLTIKLVQKSPKVDIIALRAQAAQKFFQKELKQKIAQFETKNKPKISPITQASTPEEIADNIYKSYNYFKEVVTLTNYMNFQYIGEIQVGKSKQPFRVLFDTGSNQLWVPQDTCDSCTFANTRYHCQQDSCSTSTNEITYGQGYVKGVNSKDQVTIGKKSTNYPFLSITESKDLNGFQSDGIMGMGVNRTESIVNRLYQEKKIEKNIFAFKMSTIDMSNVPADQQETPTDVTSQLTLGGFDESLISESDINYFQVVSTHYWAIKLNSARYNKKDLFNSKGQFRSALIDSGTSLIHMPTKEYQQFNKTVFDSNANNCFEFGIIICSCNQKKIPNQPRISLTLTDMESDDQIINILPEYFIMYNQGFCIYLVAEFPSIGVNDMWILGDVFMRQTYNIFDYDRKAIGIVNLYPEDEDGNPTSSSFGGFGKFVILVLVLGVGGYLAYFIYNNYIKERQPQQESQQEQPAQYHQFQDQQGQNQPSQQYQQPQNPMQQNQQYQTGTYQNNYQQPNQYYQQNQQYQNQQYQNNQDHQGNPYQQQQYPYQQQRDIPLQNMQPVREDLL